jgi:hypothetical protein
MNLQNDESTVYKSEFVNAYDKAKMNNTLEESKNISIVMNNTSSGRSSRNLNELPESSHEIERFENNVRTLEDLFKEKNEAKRRVYQHAQAVKEIEAQPAFSLTLQKHLQERKIKKQQ